MEQEDQERRSAEGLISVQCLEILIQRRELDKLLREDSDCGIPTKSVTEESTPGSSGGEEIELTPEKKRTEESVIKDLAEASVDDRQSLLRAGDRGFPGRKGSSADRLRGRFSGRGSIGPPDRWPYAKRHPGAWKIQAGNLDSNKGTSQGERSGRGVGIRSLSSYPTRSFCREES